MEDVETTPAPMTASLLAEAACEIDADPLCKQIAATILHATGGRVHQLRVAIADDCVRLTGYCATFHCNQIAQTAAMHEAAMHEAEDLTIDNQIVVW